MTLSIRQTKNREIKANSILYRWLYYVGSLKIKEALKNIHTILTKNGD
jgi:hypothetical protein